MNEADIKRINELYHKQKEIGLSDKEKAEQAALRKQYIESIRKNMRGSLDNVSIINPDGSVTNLSDVRKKHKR